MKAYPTYREFTKCLYCMQTKRKLIPKWKKVIYYGLGLILITFLWLSFYMFLAMLKGSRSSNSVRYPSSKYKKVIKEGLLWDTYEYHER
jgi:hypothetical protein